MAQKKKLGKNRLDKYYHLAKEQGFRSRAAFKLIQLNRKYNFLSKCRSLLDLCAAPGGWLQVAAKHMPMGSLIMGVDLVPIKPVRGVKCFLSDITTQECRTLIRREASGGKFDVVLHDGAPNVGGAWASEAYSQSALVLDSLKLATEVLAPKGTFVTKIFRSKDYNALLYAFQQLFDKVDATKPAASRNTSAEIFVVCLGYKAPAKIDPRLLDHKSLFQEVSEVKKVMGPEALLRMKVKQRRFREGYAEGLSTSHKALSALGFVASDTPVEVLGQFTQIALNGPPSWVAVEGLDADVDAVKELAAVIRGHEATSAEVRELCGDLQVLGRTEFKTLLRWRLALRKALAGKLGVETSEASAHKKKKPKKEEADAGAGAGEGAEPMDEEERLLAEMEAVKERMEHDAKKAKKKRREMKQKARVRSAQLAAAEGIGEDNQGGDPDSLFSLTALPGRGLAPEIAAPGAEELEALEASSDDDEDAGSDSDDDGSGSEMDSDLEYEQEMEAALDHSYKEYLSRKGVRAEAERAKRKRLGMDGELGSDEEGEGAAGAAAAGADGPELATEESEEEELGRHELLVSLDDDRLGVAKTGAAMANQWFKQELFQDPDLLDDDDEEDEEEEAAPPRGAKAGKAAAAAKGKGKAAKKARAAADSDEEGGAAEAAGAGPSDSDEGSDEDEMAKRRARSKEASTRTSKHGFEVVPAAASKKGAGSDSDASEGETDSEDEFDMLDDQGKAEVLALAKRMLRRKEKESIVDAAYNRFAFHDTGLPKWFYEDERRHMRPIAPVTKEEVEEEKARLRAVDARPIKKIAEAKARKKKKVGKRLEKAREKANAIADQEDVPDKSKAREINKLYARALSTGKRGGKGGKGGKGKRGPPLDKRMLKDKKSMVRAQQKAKKAGGRKAAKAGGGGVRKGGVRKGGKGR